MAENNNPIDTQNNNPNRLKNTSKAITQNIKTLKNVKEENKLLKDKQKIVLGLNNDDEVRNCSFTGFLHNKRMYYLENYKESGEELKNLKTNKEKLNFFKKKVEEGKILTEQEMKQTMKKGFRDKFLKRYKTEPSKEDFLNLDEDLNAKCKNLPNVKPFVPDDPSEMGGHPGAFINVVVEGKDGECDIWGGKKWVDDSIIEYAFYQYIYKNKDNNELHDDTKKLFESLTNNMSKFKLNSKCKPANPLMSQEVIDNLNYHFPIENVKNLVREGDEKIHYLDFKLGYRTAFKHEKGESRLTKQRDKNWSVSNDIGFRLEGSSFVKKLLKIIQRIPDESGWKENITQSQILKKSGIKLFEKADQFNLYKLNPGFIFDCLFYNTPDEHIRQFKIKLEEFEKDFIDKNFKNYIADEKSAVAFIGCSIFLVVGNKGIDFKLIDFAHPYVLSSITENGVKKLNPNDKSCCAVNTVTAEEFKGQTSQNNKLGYISHSKKLIKQEIKTSDDALKTKEKIRQEQQKIIDEQKEIKKNTKNLQETKKSLEQNETKAEEVFKNNKNKIEQKNNEINNKIEEINKKRIKLTEEKVKSTTLFNNIKAQSNASLFKTKIDNKAINKLNQEQTNNLIQNKTTNKTNIENNIPVFQTTITENEDKIKELKNKITKTKQEIKDIKKDPTKNNELRDAEEKLKVHNNDLNTTNQNIKTAKNNKNKKEEEKKKINKEIQTLEQYLEFYNQIIEIIVSHVIEKQKEENPNINEDDIKTAITDYWKKKNIPDILNELKNTTDLASNNLNTYNTGIKNDETELNKALKSNNKTLDDNIQNMKKHKEDNKKQLKQINKEGEKKANQIAKDMKQLEKDNLKLIELMKKAKDGDFSFKRNISYKEWSNTFQNFMGGLLSFIYSYYFWCNTRFYSENKDEMNRKENELKENFKKYNEYFDDDDPKPSTEDEKRDWDPPYPWTQSKKQDKIKILISKAKSNLLNRPKQ